MLECAEINCTSFDNLRFPLEVVNIEIWVLKVTVRKFLLSSLVAGLTMLKARVLGIALIVLQCYSLGNDGTLPIFNS